MWFWSEKSSLLVNMNCPREIVTRLGESVLYVKLSFWLRLKESIEGSIEGSIGGFYWRVPYGFV